jgi:hypothetical protein
MKLTHIVGAMVALTIATGFLAACKKDDQKAVEAFKSNQIAEQQEREAAEYVSPEAAGTNKFPDALMKKCSMTDLKNPPDECKAFIADCVKTQPWKGKKMMAWKDYDIYCNGIYRHINK